jgi:acyl-CoA dehydrogenase
VGLLEYTLKKVIANEEADKKLERAIRKGDVKRYHNNDWIAEAKSKGVLTEEEASSLAELRDLVARVIAVDDFDAASLAARRAPAPPSLTTVRPEPHEHIAAE